MRVQHELELPRPENFYTKQLHFEVKVDGLVCALFTMNDGTTFTLEAPTLLAAALSGVHGTLHDASLEALTVAALRFYRSGNVRLFSPAEYIDLLFLTRYQWGLAFEENSRTSIKHAVQQTLHPEALKTHTEQFAYGLAVHFVAKLLGVPTDRFFFINGAGARPDFRARISAAELAASTGGNIAALTPGGHMIQLEVKARTGWANYHKGEEGLQLLYNLSMKASSSPNYATISIVISLPGKGQSRQKRTRILVADPGDPPMLDAKDQLVLLLEEALPLLIRHGLWPTLSSALDWLKDVRGSLTDHERSLFEFIEQHRNEVQYRLHEKLHGGRVFNGRVFSDVVLRLGRLGERGMTRDEAEERLTIDDLGRAWYSGVDKEWIRIVQAHDAEGFLNFGLRSAGGKDLSAQSAFIILDEPMTDDIRQGVRGALKAALRRW
jgi:hypothetical protein